MSAKFSEVFESFIDAAKNLAKASKADALLFLLDEPTDFARLKKKTGNLLALVAGHSEEMIAAAEEVGIPAILLEIPEASVQDRLTQAVLESVADEHLMPGSKVVAVYSGFDTEQIDSISLIQLSERLGRLTARDLKKLETKVPLETLKVVVDLAVDVGREGREGKSVGTMFVVGDHRKVVDESRPAGFDPMKGYTRKERSIFDGRVREGIKEIAQLDGAFIVAADGTVESSCRLIDTAPVELTMTTGLGARHFSGAAISKNTKAIAVVVSESNGTVRIYQNGEVVLRIEPMQRAMKWKDFSKEPTADSKPEK